MLRKMPARWKFFAGSCNDGHTLICTDAYSFIIAHLQIKLNTSWTSWFILITLFTLSSIIKQRCSVSIKTERAYSLLNQTEHITFKPNQLWSLLIKTEHTCSLLKQSDHIKLKSVHTDSFCFKPVAKKNFLYTHRIDLPSSAFWRGENSKDSVGIEFWYRSWASRYLGLHFHFKPLDCLRPP